MAPPGKIEALGTGYQLCDVDRGAPFSGYQAEVASILPLDQLGEVGERAGKPGHRPALFAVEHRKHLSLL